MDANLRDGLDLNRRPLPARVSEHKLDLGLKREILPADLLHASVSFEADPGGRMHNDPPPGMKLARVDDNGVIVPG